MRYYCLFCRAGAEKTFAKNLRFLLHRDYPACDDSTVMFPVRLISERKNGTWKSKEQPLLPGYVFLYLDDDDPFPSIQVRQCDGFYKVLKYTDGSADLRGPDREYAQWIRTNGGVLKPSKISLDEGNVITVISGPLKDMQGRVVKLDKHKKRVVVAFEFAGEIRNVNLSVEFVSKENATT